MQKTLEPIIVTAVALLFSVLLIALFITSTGNDPIAVFKTIYKGSFGSWFSVQNTLVRAAPLLLTALCTAIPARAGLVIIGGEGAMVIGGLFSAITGISLSGNSPIFILTAMMLSGAMSGGLWIALAGFLNYYRGVNETISSLLLNYIAIAILNFLVFGMLKDPETLNKPSSFHIGEANMLGVIGESSIHWGIVFGILLCLLLWFVSLRTTFGFSVSIVGGNPRAAKLAGISVGKMIVISCFIGGACAGLAGGIEVAAVHGRANGSLNSGYGYAGILVAFLARHNPLAIIPFAVLMGGIQAAGGLLQRRHGLPDASVEVIQGMMFVVILGSEALYGRMPFFKNKSIGVSV